MSKLGVSDDQESGSTGFINSARPAFSVAAPTGFRIYCVAVLAALLLGAFSFVQQGRLSIRSPIERDYGEGIVLWQAQHVTNLQEAFRPLTQYPYIVFHYPPVFHYCARLVNMVFPDLLAAGRTVSFLAALGIALLTGAMVFLSVEQRGMLRLLASGAAGLLALHLPATFWSLLMRVDTIGIFLSFCGLFLYLRSDRIRGLEYAAFVCFVAAVYSKQTLVAAPAACLLCAAAVSWRKALRLLVFAIVVGSLIGAYFSVATHGLFFKHLFGYNVNPPNLRGGLWLFRSDLQQAAILIVIAFAEAAMVLVPVLASWSTRAWRRDIASLLTAGTQSRLHVLASVYMIFALVVSSTACKQGADINYFLEWNLVCCLLAGLFISQSLAPWQIGQQWSRMMAMGVVALAFLAFDATQAISDPTRYRESDPYRTAYDHMLQRVQAMPGLVYSDVMTILLRSGKQLPAEPAIITVLANVGTWDERPFVERVQRKEFEAVLTGSSLESKAFYTPGVRKVIQENYELTYEEGPFKLYTPRH